MKINSKKIAEEIFEELYHMFDGYYITSGGNKSVINQIVKIIDRNINEISQ